MTQTISEEYRREQRLMHHSERYGVASLGYAPLVHTLVEIGALKSLSDYGAGKCKLGKALGDLLSEVEYWPYDPAFPEYGPARSAELVTCIDVLEHVEPECLDACLDDIASITERIAFLAVHTGPARKSLSDGRNAHLIQKPVGWWLSRLALRFDILHLRRIRKGFFVIARPKRQSRAVELSFDLPAMVRAADQFDPRPDVLTRAAVAAKRDAAALWLAARDPRTPWYVKLLAGLAPALGLSPIDLTPDVLPLGHADDYVFLIIGIIAALLLIPRPLLTELRVRAGVLAYSSAAGAATAMLGIWLAAAAVLTLRLWLVGA